jgi:hypothetical protein
MRRIAFLIVGAILAGCGSGGSEDWYYHWDCNGDSDCLATNPTGAPSGTLNEGPVQVDCTSLMTFAAHFWGPTAVNSCDHSPGGGASAPTISGFVPSSGAPGTVVTISGTNLAGATVTLNGVSAPVTSAIATQVVVTIPPMGTFNGPFVATTPGGSATSTGSFSVSAASQGGGGEVFLTGTNEGAVGVFGRTANGNVAPLRRITGAATLLAAPIAATLDATRGELFVLNVGGPVLAFARTASGNASPLRSLQVTGQILRADAAHGELAVVGSELNFYSSTATSTAAPLRTLQVLPTTGVTTTPYDVAIDPVNDEVLVLTGNSTSQALVVSVYARTATGTTAAKRTLTAFPAQATGYAGLAVDTVNGELWVTSGGSQGTRVFSRTASGAAAALRSTTVSGTAIYVDPTNNEVGLASSSSLQLVGFTVLSRTSLAVLRSVSGSQAGLSGQGSRIDLGL